MKSGKTDLADFGSQKPKSLRSDARCCGIQRATFAWLSMWVAQLQASSPFMSPINSNA